MSTTKAILYFTSTPDSFLPQQNLQLSTYINYLRSRYRANLSMSSTQWPPVPTAKIFKLAMIQKENIQRGRIDDDLIRMSITGKVDDILQCKTRVEIENIFTNCGEKRRCVLIEGAPGSGKSTLALHICQEWAEGKLFQEYDVVVLVRLRDPLITEAKTVADLLPRADKTMAKEAETAIKTHFGRGVLWVLDGWEELPSEHSSESIINKLIEPDKFQESPLHRSAVIVTSRPSSSAELHPLVSSRVEVLGFTPHELEQFFKECLNNDTRAVQPLLERIRENPVVEGSCYLPLNAAIVAHVFLCGDHSLPTSNHGIFMEVVKSYLKRYLQDKRGVKTSIGNITCPDSLPSEIQTSVRHLCRMAFKGIKANKLTFSESDLTALSISKEIIEIGLLQSVSSLVSDGHQTYFCFNHLSIQELLAAVHISHKSPRKQISVFHKQFGTSRLNAVFQFYAGITKLKASRSLPQVLCRAPTSVYKLVKKEVKKSKCASHHTEKPFLVSLLHCLYEAEDSSLCEFVADILDNSLDLHSTTLTPLDSLYIGYFLSAVCTTVMSDTFRVTLGGCSIGDQGCKFLVRGLSKRLSTQSKITSQLDVNLFNNNIHEEGVQHIAELLRNTSVVSELALSDNPIGEGGLKSLCEALSTNTTLKRLDLNECSLTLGDDNGHSLSQLLRKNTFLSYLSLSRNKVTNCHQIAAGLSNNKTLRTLKLTNCDLTDEILKEFCTGLNDYIEELYINSNELVTEEGLRILARCLATLPGMRRLMIPFHLKPLDTPFIELNKKRRRNGLQEIDANGEWQFQYNYT